MNNSQDTQQWLQIKDADVSYMSQVNFSFTPLVWMLWCKLLQILGATKSGLGPGMMQAP